MNNGLETLESLRIIENVSDISAESIENTRWENPEVSKSGLSENFHITNREYSTNLIEAYFEKHRLHDSDVSYEIASKLERMEGVRYEKWSELSEREKLDLLNEIEQTQAKLQCRDPMRIEFENMGNTYHGYQDEYNKRIVLNRNEVLSNDPRFHRLAVETIVHEGRHAYQHYNIDVRTIHESDAEVATWRENYNDPNHGYYRYKGQKMYIPGENGGLQETDDFRLYEYQPVEIDARVFASDVMSRLDRKGLFAA